MDILLFYLCWVTFYVNFENFKEFQGILSAQWQVRVFNNNSKTSLSAIL